MRSGLARLLPSWGPRGRLQKQQPQPHVFPRQAAVPGFSSSLEGLARAMESLLLPLRLLSEVPVALESSPQGSWTFPGSHFSSMGLLEASRSLLQGIPIPVAQAATESTLWEAGRGRQAEKLMGFFCLGSAVCENEVGPSLTYCFLNHRSSG